MATDNAIVIPEKIYLRLENKIDELNGGIQEQLVAIGRIETDMQSMRSQIHDTVLRSERNEKRLYAVESDMRQAQGIINGVKRVFWTITTVILTTFIGWGMYELKSNSHDEKHPTAVVYPIVQKPDRNRIVHENDSTPTDPQK